MAETPMFDGTPYAGSLWRDYNDHIFRLDRITEDLSRRASDEKFGLEPLLTLHGTMMYCPDWCQDPRHADGQPYETWALPKDLPSGEIFGWSLMWMNNGPSSHDSD
jgi:hypothetical protein